MRGWAIAILMGLVFGPACFGQATQPATQPAPSDPVAALQAARDRVKAGFDQSSDGTAPLQKIALAQQGLDAARASGDEAEISSAATDMLTVKSAYTRALSAAYAADPDVEAAQAAAVRMSQCRN